MLKCQGTQFGGAQAPIEQIDKTLRVEVAGKRPCFVGEALRPVAKPCELNFFHVPRLNLSPNLCVEVKALAR